MFNPLVNYLLKNVYWRAMSGLFWQSQILTGRGSKVLENPSETPECYPGIIAMKLFFEESSLPLQ